MAGVLYSEAYACEACAATERPRAGHRPGPADPRDARLAAGRSCASARRLAELRRAARGRGADEPELATLAAPPSPRRRGGGEGDRMSRLNRGTGTLYRPTYRASDGTIRQQAVWWMWWMQ